MKPNILDNVLQRATLALRLVCIDFLSYRNKIVVAEMRGHGNNGGGPPHKGLAVGTKNCLGGFDYKSSTAEIELRENIGISK
jgi:hypothetical protein